MHWRCCHRSRYCRWGLIHHRKNTIHRHIGTIRHHLLGQIIIVVIETSNVQKGNSPADWISGGGGCDLWGLADLIRSQYVLAQTETRIDEGHIPYQATHVLWRMLSWSPHGRVAGRVYVSAAVIFYPWLYLHHWLIFGHRVHSIYQYTHKLRLLQ